MILMAVLASTVVGTSAIGLNAHARDLLLGIFQDVDEILTSFAGGPNDPNNPIDNQATLNRDAQRLNSATDKAEQLASEMNNLRQGNNKQP